MTQKVKTWAELEQAAGIQRTEQPRPTQRDVAVLTAKRVRGPFWRKKR